MRGFERWKPEETLGPAAPATPCQALSRVPAIDGLRGGTYNTNMESPQIVLDTNVLVAGLRSRRGASFRLLSLVGSDRFHINLSVPLLLEYEDVLLRPGSEVPLSDAEIQDVLDFHCAVAQHHRIFFLWRPFLRDPHDDMVLEVAVTAGCRFIITFNERDFAGVERFGIRACPPAEFLREIGVPR